MTTKPKMKVNGKVLESGKRAYVTAYISYRNDETDYYTSRGEYAKGIRAAEERQAWIYNSSPSMQGKFVRG